MRRFNESPIRGEIVKVDSLDEAQVRLWNELASDNPATASPFFSYIYALTASSVFYGVRVCLIWQNDRIVGFFPYQFCSPLHRFFGIGMRIGGEYSDYFGIISKTVYITPQKLLEIACLKALYFTHLDDSQRSFGLIGERPEIGYRIKINDGGSGYWRELKLNHGKFVSDTERRERKLIARFGPIRFVFRQEDPLPHLHNLIEKKREQYRRTSGRDSLNSEASRRFLHRLAQCRDPLCHGTLSTLYAGETWVASHFGLMYNDILHYWFPVYNRELDVYSPGRLLMAAMIRSSDTNGVRCIDRGAGDTQSKRDFLPEQHVFMRGLWRRSGVISLGYNGGLSITWRIKSALSFRNRGR